MLYYTKDKVRLFIDLMVLVMSRRMEREANEFATLLSDYKKVYEQILDSARRRYSVRYGKVFV